MTAVKLNQADVAKVKALLGDLKDKYKTVIVRSINKSLQTAQTQATARIGNEINLKAARIKKDFTLKKANYSDMSGSLKMTGKPVGLVQFGARQTQKGVSVKVLKSESRSVLKHAFITTGKGSKKEHVFWRQKERKTMPKPKRFPMGKISKKGWKHIPKPYKLPLERLTGPRIEDIFAQPKVLDPVTIQAQHLYFKNVAAEVDNILRMHRD